MKKLNNILSVFMGSFIGDFIGHCFSVYLFFQKHPEIYARQSAPWWVNVIPYGIITVVILTVLMVAKIIIKHKKPTETEKK